MTLNNQLMTVSKGCKSLAIPPGITRRLESDQHFQFEKEGSHVSFNTKSQMSENLFFPYSSGRF
jgi:hypothetical protein